MKLTKDQVNNLGTVFYTFFETEEDKMLAMKILKIFDFEYKGSKLYYEPLNLIYTEKDKDLSNNKITPFSISRMDLDDIETALNSVSLKSVANKVSPIFDAIGWVLRLDVDSWRIHFIGGPQYDIWKEPDLPWNYDLEEEAVDWKTGNDWVDGLDLEKEFPVDWVNS